MISPIVPLFKVTDKDGYTGPMQNWVTAKRTRWEPMKWQQKKLKHVHRICSSDVLHAFPKLETKCWQVARVYGEGAIIWAAEGIPIVHWYGKTGCIALRVLYKVRVLKKDRIIKYKGVTINKNKI